MQKQMNNVPGLGNLEGAEIATIGFDGDKKKSEQKKHKVVFPEYWKRKKLKQSFIDELTESINSEVKHTDQYGDYRVGVFLSGYTMTRVNIIDGLWCCEIYSEKPVGLPAIKEIRKNFLPDDMVFAMILPPRKLNQGDNLITLYQIPGDLKDQ